MLEIDSRLLGNDYQANDINHWIATSFNFRYFC